MLNCQYVEKSNAQFYTLKSKVGCSFLEAVKGH
jgi:hypothetical protein